MNHDNLDEEYRNTESEHSTLPPAGFYRCRVTGTQERVASTGSPGLRVEFTIVDGPYEGSTYVRDFWLTGGALKISKRELGAIGFGDMLPSQIAAMQDFKAIPTLLVQFGYRLFEGAPRLQLDSFLQAEPGHCHGA